MHVHRVCSRITNKHTWFAYRIFTGRAFVLHAAVRTSVVLSAFLAGVMLGVERAAGAIFAL